MTEFSLNYRQYRLQFKSSFRLHNRIYHHRDGFIVDLSDCDGFTGLGEAAPLPGFSRENLDSVENELSALQKQFDSGRFSPQYGNGIPEIINEGDFSPSVRFAILTAYLDYRAKRANFKLSAYIQNNAADRISVNALVGLMPIDEALQKASEDIRNGYESLKVKIGRPDIKDDFRLLRDLGNLTKNNIPLRPDVNQAWSYDQAKDYIEQLAEFNLNIDYIEQPIQSAEIDSLKKLNLESPIPLAADESLNHVDDLNDLIQERSIPVFVWKPSVFGPQIFNREIHDGLCKNSIRVIISSGFESIVGLGGLCQFTAACFPEEIHGLGTEDIFERNVSQLEIYKVKNGKITLPAGSGIGINDLYMDENR